MKAVKKVRLLGVLVPHLLKPLSEIVPRFDKFNSSLCHRCRNFDNRNFWPNPCRHRQNYAWKKCSHFDPIARNGFLADRVRRLTKYGLSLDEAIGLLRREIGDIAFYGE